MSFCVSFAPLKASFLYVYESPSFVWRYFFYTILANVWSTYSSNWFLLFLAKNVHASARSFIPWVSIPTSQCDFSFVLCAIKTTGSAEA